MASSGTGVLSAARSRWRPSARAAGLALGTGLLAAGVLVLLTGDAGARLLLGLGGGAVAVRGAVLLRGGAVPQPAVARAVGLTALVLGGAGVACSVASASWSGRVLVVAVPTLLLLTAQALLTRGGTARRGGAVLLGWTVLLTMLLVAAALGQGEQRAVTVATSAGGLALAVLAVPALLAAARPTAAPSETARSVGGGCGGCACGAGGCGAIGG